MHDIKIPSAKTDFEVTHMPSHEAGVEPGEKVKVKFGNFVQLVASHDFEEVMKNHKDDDIILNTNLLADLASAHEEIPVETKKTPMILIVGIVIGIVLTYFLIRS